MILPTTLSPLPVCPSGDDPAGAAPRSHSLEDFVAAGAVRKAILGTSELPIVEVLPVDDFDDCFAGRADFPLPKRAAKWTPRPRSVPAATGTGTGAAPAPAPAPAAAAPVSKPKSTARSKDSARAQLAADLGIHLAPEPAEFPRPAKARAASAAAAAATGLEPDELEVPDMALENPVVHPAFEVIPPARRAAPPQLHPRERADCEAAYGRSSTRRGERWWVIGMGLAACAVLFSGTLVDFISREAMRRSHVESVALPAKVKGSTATAPAGIAITARAGATAVPNPAATATAPGTAAEKSLPLAATAKDDDKPE